MSCWTWEQPGSTRVIVQAVCDDCGAVEWFSSQEDYLQSTWWIADSEPGRALCDDCAQRVLVPLRQQAEPDQAKAVTGAKPTVTAPSERPKKRGR